MQYPWESQPGRYHSKVLPVRPFYLDRTEVTNAQYQRFEDATGYRPADRHHFLADWDWSDPRHPHYRPGWADRPVTWVSLDDARAYARWAGKRLPHEWEWQYAAQGLDGRNYPWGNAFQPSRVPATSGGRDGIRPPDNVTAHPTGAGPFGNLDMVGNVWQWTDEYTDQHTSAAVLRGGSYFRAATSNWYFPSDRVRIRWATTTVSAHGAEPRPVGHHRVPLRRGRAGTVRAAGRAGPDRGRHRAWLDRARLDLLPGRQRLSRGGIGGAGASGQYAQYSFTGTGVDVYGWQGPNAGTLRMSLDGRPYGDPVGQYAPTNDYNRLLARIGGLRDGKHTLRVEPAAPTNAGQWTMVNYLRVYTDGRQPPAPPTVTPAETLLAPHGSAKVTVTFRNTGGNPVSGRLSLDPPPGGSVTPNGPTRFDDLPPGHQAVAAFTVRGPGGAGSYLLRAHAKLPGGQDALTWSTLSVLGRVDPVTATPGLGGWVDLGWRPADPNGMASYQVYASTTLDNPGTLAGTTTDTSFTHSGLGPLQTWYYRVRATDGGSVAGPLSAEASATTSKRTVVEAAALMATETGTAPAVLQSDCCNVHWIGGQQIWFQARAAGDTYTLPFTVPATAEYDLVLDYTKAPDFGIHTQTLDGAPLGPPYDHYDPAGVSLDDHDYGRVRLAAGRHTLTFTVTGKQPVSPRYGFGLNAVELTPAG